MNLYATASPIVLLLIGLLVCFFGHRLLHLTIGLAGFGIGLVFGLEIGKLVPHASQVLAVVIGVVCGVLLAILATVLFKFGIFLLGAAAGAALGSVVVAATGWHHPLLIRAIFAVAVGIITVLLERPLVSFVSAFAGSWVAVVAAFRLMNWYQAVPRTTKPPAYYGPLIACWLVVALIGVTVQLGAADRHLRHD